MNFIYWLKKIEKGFFWVLLMLVLGIYFRTYFTYYDQILPAYNDEYGYYLQVKNFYENTSLKMPFSLDGLVSEVGQFSFHGFSYGLFHGSIAKIFGFHNHSIFTQVNRT